MNSNIEDIRQIEGKERPNRVNGEQREMSLQKN